jgi:hypothetical protein
VVWNVVSKLERRGSTGVICATARLSEKMRKAAIGEVYSPENGRNFKFMYHLVQALSLLLLHE